MIQLYEHQLKEFMNSPDSVSLQKSSYLLRFVPFGSRIESKLAIECLSTLVIDNKTYNASIIYSEESNWYINCGLYTLTLLDNKSKNLEENLGILDIKDSSIEESCYIHKKYRQLFNRDEYSNHNYHGGVLCDHTSAMLASLPGTILSEMQSELHNILKDDLSIVEDIDTTKEKTDKPIVHFKNSDIIQYENSPLVNLLNTYAFKGESILILGHAGYGKSYNVKQYAKNSDLVYVELQGHQQIESLDMFGYLMETPTKEKVWFDGPISRAARLAEKGEKVLLFIDELLNIPMKETAGLKASLEPFNGHYYFQTNRMINYEDGIGESEMIKVPVENLQVVSAGNIGDGYLSEELDRALKQRFLIFNHTMSNKEIKNVLLKIANAKDYSESIVEKIMDFYEEMITYYTQDMISSAPSLRQLSRKLLELIEDESDLYNVAMAQKYQWIGFDELGNPDEAEESIVEGIIKACL